MRTATAQATAIAARLGAVLDTEPDVTETGDGIRIQVSLPEQLSGTQQTAVLAALADADRYGHTTATTGRTVWALITKEQP